MKNKFVIVGTLIAALFAAIGVYQWHAYEKKRNIILEIVNSVDLSSIFSDIRSCRIKNSILDVNYSIVKKENSFVDQLISVCNDKKCVTQLISDEVKKECALSEELKNSKVLNTLVQVNKPILIDGFKDAKRELEVIVVSGYEGLGKTDLFLDRPGKNVLLILGTYNKHEWDIYVGLTSKLVGVVSSGRYQQTVRSNIVVSNSVSSRFDHVSSAKGMSMVRLLETLNSEYKIERVSNFYGAYKLDKEYFLINSPLDETFLSLSGESPSRLESEHIFHLITDEFEPTQWTVNGPIDSNVNRKYRFGSEAFLESTHDSFDFFHAYGHTVAVINPYFDDIILPALPDAYPSREDQKISSIALDIENNQLIVLGDRIVFFFDVTSRSWTGFKELNLPFGFYKIVYDSSTHNYFVLKLVYGDSEPEIIVFDSEWNIIKTYSLKNKLNEYFRVSYGEGPYIPNINLVVDQNNLVLVAIEEDQVIYIWNYNLVTEKVDLTYKNPLKLHPEEPNLRIKLNISNPILCKKDC